MDEIGPVQEIETRAAAAGINVTALCREAGVARSTFTRWKSGDTQPQYRLLRRMLATLEGMEKPALQEAS